MAYRKWSPEDDKVIDKLYNKVPINDICNALNATRAQVKGRALKLGKVDIKPPKQNQHLFITEHKGYRVIQHYAI